MKNVKCVLSSYLPSKNCSGYWINAIIFFASIASRVGGQPVIQNLASNTPGRAQYVAKDLLELSRVDTQSKAVQTRMP